MVSPWKTRANTIPPKPTQADVVVDAAPKPIWSMCSADGCPQTGERVAFRFLPGAGGRRENPDLSCVALVRDGNCGLICNCGSPQATACCWHFRQDWILSKNFWCLYVVAAVPAANARVGGSGDCVLKCYGWGYRGKCAEPGPRPPPNCLFRWNCLLANSHRMPTGTARPVARSAIFMLSKPLSCNIRSGSTSSPRV